MTVTDISFRQTRLFSKLILDYIAQDEQVSEFCAYPPVPDEIEKIIAGKQQESIDRNHLAAVIHKQYEYVQITEELKQNIEALKEQHTFCIVTAHQLNIFTGPLYYIYKIAQTISTCRQLNVKYPSYNFVPVYWMGSEDHDFEEINHISVYNKKIEWTDHQGGATGAYTTSSLLSLIDEIESLLGNEPHAKELIELFRKSYSLFDLSAAARYLVNALFGQYGLVIVDGNDAALKQQYADVMKAELVHQHSYKLVKEQLEKLEAKGYQQQAAPRAINLFYLSKNSRERIVYEHSKFSIQHSDLVFSESEILQELQTHPERFSPNVILRPLYQQKILPALAYIGGAGELAYWLQLKSVFDFYNVNFPQLLLRNSALLYSEAQAAKTERAWVFH
jgi:bacillithiol synthase